MDVNRSSTSLPSLQIFSFRKSAVTSAQHAPPPPCPGAPFVLSSATEARSAVGFLPPAFNFPGKLLCLVTGSLSQGRGWLCKGASSGPLPSSLRLKGQAGPVADCPKLVRASEGNRAWCSGSRRGFSSVLLRGQILKSLRGLIKSLGLGRVRAVRELIPRLRGASSPSDSPGFLHFLPSSPH